MLNRVLGKKIGTTQVFDKTGNVVPVTVVDVAHWFVTQVKTGVNDGYAALQLGLLKKKFREKEFSQEWLKHKSDYFTHLKEVRVDGDVSLLPGQAVTMDEIALAEGTYVDVTGTSKGLGFQGVVKRWGFGGGPDSHGSTFHRRPGASGHMRTQGEVIKGKRFPGHLGAEQVTVKGLQVVLVDKELGCLFIKGSVPGKKDSLVAIKEQGK
ncbi:MAG: 50S ribosomal protein L3 [Candidatus Babeliales bacterium]